MPTPFSTARVIAARLLTEIWGSRGFFGSRPKVEQRVEIVEQMGRSRRAEGDEMMVVEILDLARLRRRLEIVGRSIGMEMHGEEPAPDKVRLHRLAQAERHVGLAHREVEIVVRQQKLQFDLRIELDEFAEPRARASSLRGRAWS